MALLIPDESSLVSVDDKKFYAFKNAAGYHPGQVAPSTADPASLRKVDSCQSRFIFISVSRFICQNYNLVLPY